MNNLTQLFVDKFNLLLSESIELLLEAARIQHIEDIIFWEGSRGALRAVKSLESLQAGNTKDLSVKWDGSPAIIFGRNQSGQFVLTDKNGFVAKSYNGKPTSAVELEKMFLGRGSNKDISYRQFAANMKSVWPIFEESVPTEFRGYFKGDLLYFNTPKLENGRYIFKPNIVTYSVSETSELGKKISKSVVGVVVHRIVDEAGTEYPIKDLNLFKGARLLVIPPIIVQKPPVIDKGILRKLESSIKRNARDIDSLLDKNKLSAQKMTDFPDILYKYINSKVDTGLEGLGKDFLKWLSKSNVSDTKKKKIDEYIRQNVNGFIALWEIVTSLMSIKDNIVDQIDSQNVDIQTSINGKPGGEGYVLSQPDGDIKLVSRSKFSAANRAVVREDIVEGGWLNPKLTSGTKLTPDIIEKVNTQFNIFIGDLNEFILSKNIPIIKEFKILGSAAYYIKDLEDKKETQYGDIDMMLVLEKSPDETDQQTKSKYQKIIVDFVENSSQGYVDKESARRSHGSQLIIKLGEESWVQLDLLFTLEEYKDWFSTRFTPQRGIKGFVIGNLYSSLADTLNISISDRGVRTKTKDGKIVSYSLKKDVIDKLVTKHPKTFLYDICTFLSKFYELPLQEIDPNLDANRGMDPKNIDFKGFVKGVYGLAKTLEKSGILDKMGFTYTSFITSIKSKYSEKSTDQLNKREKKSDSEETQQSIDKIKKNIEFGTSILGSTLNEGGNVFKDPSGKILTHRINKPDVIPTINWLEKLTGLKLVDNTLGTTGIKDSSGDLDLAVDVSTISKEQLSAILIKWAIKTKHDPKEFVKKTGDSVHFKTPILGNEENGFVQTDFMFGDPAWMKWSMRGEPEPYRGMQRHVLLASIAKYKNLKWSYKNGLVDRSTDKIVSKNPKEIAKILLGVDATEKDLENIPTIINKIKSDPNYDAMTAEARQTLKQQYNAILP